MNNTKIVTREYDNNAISFELLDSTVTMVNLTQMAKPFGKVPAEWLRLPSTISYLETLNNHELSVGKSQGETKQHVKRVNGGNNNGTWASKRVAIRFAQWLSDEFAIWVDEQIEQLLTTGTVTIAKSQHTLPQTFAEALQLAADQARQLEQQAPLVNFAATVQQSSALIDLNKLAKIISDNVIVIGRNNLMQLLRARGFLNQDNTPSQKSINAGLMKAVEKTYQRSDGEIGLSITAQITGAGQVYFCSNVRKFIASSDKLEVSA